MAFAGGFRKAEFMGEPPGPALPRQFQLNKPIFSVSNKGQVTAKVLTPNLTSYVMQPDAAMTAEGATNAGQ